MSFTYIVTVVTYQWERPFAAATLGGGSVINNKYGHKNKVWEVIWSKKKKRSKKEINELEVK